MLANNLPPFTGPAAMRLPKESMYMKTKSSSRKRELIEPHKGDKRYLRRNAQGEFSKSVSVSRSLSADSRRNAKKTVPKGQGDRGDTKR